MLALSEFHEPDGLEYLLRDAQAVTAKLMSDVVGIITARFPAAGRNGKAARIERLIEAEAWTDAALALIDLASPQWQLRRIAHDGAEWHCALSRQRELPDWLDHSIEAHHADLPLAILKALLDAQAVCAPSSRTSVSAISRNANPLYEPVCCDNFG